MNIRIMPLSAVCRAMTEGEYYMARLDFFSLVDRYELQAIGYAILVHARKAGKP